jgi:hypothetical protein
LVTHPATLRSFTKSHPSSIESCRLEMSLLGLVLLNLGTVATVPKFSPPLSRLLEIRRLRSNICCSNMNLLQYHGQYYYSICVSTDPNRTIKTERWSSLHLRLKPHEQMQRTRTLCLSAVPLPSDTSIVLSLASISSPTGLAASVTVLIWRFNWFNNPIWRIPALVIKRRVQRRGEAWHCWTLQLAQWQAIIHHLLKQRDILANHSHLASAWGQGYEYNIVCKSGAIYIYI